MNIYTYIRRADTESAIISRAVQYADGKARAGCCSCNYKPHAREADTSFIRHALARIYILIYWRLRHRDFNARKQLGRKVSALRIHATRVHCREF